MKTLKEWAKSLDAAEKLEVIVERGDLANELAKRVQTIQKGY